MVSKAFSIDGCIWVNKGDDCFLAAGRIILLNAIVQEKSIRAAAKKLGIPYQLAWKTIDQMNRLAPIPILITKRGGKDGGGVDLTSYGKRIIEEVNLIESEFSKLLSRLNKVHDFCF